MKGSQSLREYEQKLMAVLKREGGGVDLTDLIAETLISPDIAVHAAVSLVQQHRAILVPGTPLDEIKLMAHAREMEA